MNFALKWNWISYPFINNTKDLTKQFQYLHYGIDFGYHDQQHKNEPVYAIDDGVVIYNRYQSTGGYVIHIRHNNGFVSEYAHLQKDSQKVLEGDIVKRGQQIANMGNSGSQAKGNHLHLGLYRGEYINYNDLSKFVNPLDYLYLADWQEVDEDTDKEYHIMRESDYSDYTTGIYHCNYDMRLRTEPNTDCAMLKVKDCTKLQKEALTSQNPDAYAVFKKGTNITALEIIKNNKGEYWLRTYRNAYVCIDNGSIKYCTK